MADVDVDVSGQHSVTLPSPAAAVQAPPLPHRTAIVLKGEQLRCVMIYKKGDDLRQVIRLQDVHQTASLCPCVL